MSQSANFHIEEYLSHYAGLARPPQFAVLVRGSWGAGKSYIVRRTVKTALENTDRKWLYVSLYGLRSIDELDDALFRAAFPALANRAGKLLGRVGKAALKFVNVDEFKLSDVLDKFDYDLFVFDDVERCEIPVASVLGYINEFVEHHGRKVIIVAHEKEIEKSKRYRRRREKLIGITLEVVPEFRAAYEYFVSEFADEEFRRFLRDSVNVVERLFLQAAKHNLRALRQALGEFERLFRALEPHHKQHHEAMTSLLGMVLALALEIRAGRITADDMLQRKNLLIARVTEKKDGGGRNNLLKSSRRYPDIALDNDMLSDQILADFFGKGLVDAEAIRGSLGASHYFVSDDEPPWLTIWRALDRSRDQFESALARFNEQLDKKEFKKAGEILHAVGVRIWLAKEGFIPENEAKVVKASKKYIDEVFSQGELEPYPLHDYQDEVRHGAYGGFGFHERSSEAFKEIDGYLYKKRLLARMGTYCALGRKLMEELAVDPMLFARRICSNESGESMYSRVPVLGTIDPTEFVDAILALSSSGLGNVCIGLKARYEFGFQDLDGEEEWYGQVKRIIEEKLDSMAPFDRFRVRAHLAYLS